MGGSHSSLDVVDYSCVYRVRFVQVSSNRKQVLVTNVLRVCHIRRVDFSGFWRSALDTTALSIARVESVERQVADDCIKHVDMLTATILLRLLFLIFTGGLTLDLILFLFLISYFRRRLFGRVSFISSSIGIHKESIWVLSRLCPINRLLSGVFG